MTHFISFPKIGQFNSIIQGIISGERFRGFDEKGEKVFDSTAILPNITFTGTIKLHGTNSGMCVQNDTLWFQSRESVITPLKDNMGFASFFSGSEKQEIIMNIVNKLRQDHNIPKDKVICLFGEWAGPGVQKKVAISQIPSKSFFLFAIRVVNPERMLLDNDELGSYKEDMWLPITGIRDHSIRFYNIEDYQTYRLDINLNSPREHVEHIQSLVDAVEKECPVGKSFGISGLGEGIVWVATWKGRRQAFKTKGKEHAVTEHKSGKTVQVDTEKLNSLNEFAAYAVTEARLEQGLEKVFGQEPVTKEKTGDFIRWMINDIATEEVDAISENGFSVKEISGVIAVKSKDWLHGKIVL